MVTNQGAVIISSDGKVSRLTTEDGLSDNVLTSIYASNSVYEDREGNIWIGTIYRGLNRLSMESVAFYSKKDGLQSDFVNPIYEARDGSIWIGGNDLTQYESGNFLPVAGRENFHPGVTAIEQDRDGDFWFGNWGGVYYYKNGRIIDWTQPLPRKAGVIDIHQDRLFIRRVTVKLLLMI